jgi:hypothetical protein
VKGLDRRGLKMKTHIKTECERQAHSKKHHEEDKTFVIIIVPGDSHKNMFFFANAGFKCDLKEFELDSLPTPPTKHITSLRNRFVHEPKKTRKLVGGYSEEGRKHLKFVRVIIVLSGNNTAGKMLSVNAESS